MSWLDRHWFCPPVIHVDWIVASPPMDHVNTTLSHLVGTRSRLAHDLGPAVCTTPPNPQNHTPKPWGEDVTLVRPARAQPRTLFLSVLEKVGCKPGNATDLHDEGLPARTDRSEVLTQVGSAPRCSQTGFVNRFPLFACASFSWILALAVGRVLTNAEAAFCSQACRTPCAWASQYSDPSIFTFEGTKAQGEATCHMWWIQNLNACHPPLNPSPFLYRMYVIAHFSTACYKATEKMLAAIHSQREKNPLCHGWQCMKLKLIYLHLSAGMTNYFKKKMVQGYQIYQRTLKENSSLKISHWTS